uniref:PDZ domain-containing protein n=1 Tax=Stegastes partitus TaxID=144197 RepID=A0A3B5AJD8_9TELE
MGLRSTFSCKEPFQDQVSVSQFPPHRSAIGFEPRLKLDCLTQDGEPALQMLSHLLRPPSAQLQTAGSLIENKGRLAETISEAANTLFPPQIDITPGPDGRFGFTIVGDSPLMVEDCMPSGPAGRNGLKAGDYVMEVNGIPVKHHETAAAMIKAAQGRPLRLGVLSMARRPKRSPINYASAVPTEDRERAVLFTFSQ